MFHQLRLRRSRRWVYPIVSIVLAVGLWLGQPMVAQAIPWLDIILRGVQVVQLSSLSDQKEVALGGQINNQIKSEVRLYRDRAVNDYVNSVGQRLAKVSTRPNIPYTFQVVDDNSVNAFATMGGFVYVNRGLLREADNEAQLASVIGHEIGHITARHAINQMREMALAQGVAAAAGLNRSTIVSLGVDLALRRPHSREAEYQADQLGLATLGRAGYAQSAMVTFMSKLLGSRSVPTILSTHPDTADRIARLKQALPANANTGIGLDSTAYRSNLRSL